MLRPPPPMPVPARDALQASHALHLRIEAEIARSGGWIDFARYMQLALYEPGLGYYSGGAQKFGRAGDFVTAPLLGPLFAQTLAREVAGLMRGNADSDAPADTSSAAPAMVPVVTRSVAPPVAPRILEFGAGSGELAGELLAELARLGIRLEQYAIVEPSAGLVERQRASIARLAPESLSRVAWLDRLPAGFCGLMLANEVLDAMPVHLAGWREEGIVERGVALENGRLAWSERAASGEVLALAQEVARSAGIQPPYMSELAPAARGWIAALAESLHEGVLLVIDYGFAEREFFHPQRSSGTLMCHYRHHAHADPFLYPGLQDITAHVDFSALARAGRAAGLAVLGYATQANFLVNCGIMEVLCRTDPADAARYAPLAAGAQTLLSPAEMGELFKVLALGRGSTRRPAGFRRGDRSHTL